VIVGDRGENVRFPEGTGGLGACMTVEIYVDDMTSELSKSGEGDRRSGHVGAARPLRSLNVNIRSLSSDDRIYVAGHRGLVGSALWRRLEAKGFPCLLGAPSSELDLRDETQVDDFFAKHRPDVVVLAAARVGGILANDTYPADFLGENLRIQVNVMEAALRFGVERLLFLGSACIYPRLAEQPIPESALLTGYLEPTNDAYAIAKIAGILHVRSVRRQHGLPWISVMPTNLYGPGDNFNLHNSHLLPAMIRKFHRAVSTGASTVALWGTGSPRRELMHVDDMADACLFLLDHYDADDHINVGTGSDARIAEIAEIVARTTGFTGEIVWDATRPDGMPRRLLDTTRLTDLGWRARIGLHEGIRDTYEWFLAHQDSLRV
jgi:GDP-L-fucose synthase